MIELGYIIFGITIGSAGVLAVQWLYNWIDSMRRQVESLKWDLERYQQIKDNWVEFSFWKNEKKKEEKI